MSVRSLAVAVLLPFAVLPAPPATAYHEPCKAPVDVTCHTESPPADCDVYVATEFSLACLNQ